MISEGASGAGESPRKSHIVRCPICDGPSDFFAEPAGPFCSNRCKMVDLSKWLGEDYRISEPLDPESAEEFSADVDEEGN